MKLILSVIAMVGLGGSSLWGHERSENLERAIFFQRASGNVRRIPVQRPVGFADTETVPVLFVRTPEPQMTWYDTHILFFIASMFCVGACSISHPIAIVATLLM